ncbi:uncharacterized protein VP01_5068g1, partial [Puccinia sorghi]
KARGLFIGDSVFCQPISLLISLYFPVPRAPNQVFVEPIYKMSELDPSSIKLVTEKLDIENFMPPEYLQKCKQFTKFVHMHMTHSNLERFIPDITKYEPKLGDSIVSHFAAKTVENSANALDKLFDTQFIEGDMNKCKSLENVAVIFSLKRLSPTFTIFRQLQFTNFKGGNIKFDAFLKELELELQRQGKAQHQSNSSKALVVSQQFFGQAVLTETIIRRRLTRRRIVDIYTLRRPWHSIKLQWTRLPLECLLALWSNWPISEAQGLFPSSLLDFILSFWH